MGSVEYHLKELEIARDAKDLRRVLPEILPADKIILDIGCGIGQTFIALNCTDRICVGIDNDEAAINYGIRNYGDKIQFILSDAVRIPVPSNLFDLVYSRVSLPYTNIPRVVREMRRILRDGGRVWMTLHSKTMAARYLKGSIKSRDLGSFPRRVYTLINGYCLKYFGFIFPFVDGSYESWQDATSIKKILSSNGFEVAIVKVGRHTVIEGTLHKNAACNE